MDVSNELTRMSYPLIRVTLFGEFTLTRLAPSSPSPAEPPLYLPIPWEKWGSRGPALLLLKVLLCQPERRATRSDLMQMIWPDAYTMNVPHAFESASSLLRRHILAISDDESLLQTLRTSTELSLKLPSQELLWVDSDAFLELTAQATHADSQGEDALPLLEKAYRLARGDFLEDHVSAPWSQRRRHTLHAAKRRVFYRLIERYQHLHRLDLAEELLFTFLEEQPTDEDALCYLMQLLTTRGRRQEALEIYHYTHALLREEEREPAPYTQRLAIRIHSGQILRERTAEYVTRLDSSLSLWSLQLLHCLLAILRTVNYAHPAR